MVVTLAPIGCPKISDSVRQLPSPHSRHSPAAPELPSTTSGSGGRLGLPMKPAVDETRLRRRLHAGAGAFHPRLHQLQPLCGDAPVFLPLDFFNGVGPCQRESRNRQRLHDAGGGQAQAAATAVRGRCRHCRSAIAAVSRKPAGPARPGPTEPPPPRRQRQSTSNSLALFLILPWILAAKLDGRRPRVNPSYRPKQGLRATNGGGTEANPPQRLIQNAANGMERSSEARHARPCAGHPRLSCIQVRKTWMAGTSPAMTRSESISDV
jgi:hypothetical protein